MLWEHFENTWTSNYHTKASNTANFITDEDSLPSVGSILLLAVKFQFCSSTLMCIGTLRVCSHNGFSVRNGHRFCIKSTSNTVPITTSHSLEWKWPGSVLTPQNFPTEFSKLWHGFQRNHGKKTPLFLVLSARKSKVFPLTIWSEIFRSHAPTCEHTLRRLVLIIVISDNYLALEHIAQC